MPREKAPDEIFCRTCGERIKQQVEFCPECGVRNEKPQASSIPGTPRGDTAPNAHAQSQHESTGSDTDDPEVVYLEPAPLPKPLRIIAAGIVVLLVGYLFGLAINIAVSQIHPFLGGIAHSLWIALIAYLSYLGLQR